MVQKTSNHVRNDEKTHRSKFALFLPQPSTQSRASRSEARVLTSPDQRRHGSADNTVRGAGRRPDGRKGRARGSSEESAGVLASRLSLARTKFTAGSDGCARAGLGAGGIVPGEIGVVTKFPDKMLAQEMNTAGLGAYLGRIRWVTVKTAPSKMQTPPTTTYAIPRKGLRPPMTVLVVMMMDLVPSYSLAGKSRRSVRGSTEAYILETHDHRPEAHKYRPTWQGCRCAGTAC